MNAHTGKSRKIANKLVWIGIGLGMFWWILEAVIHVFVLHDGTLIGQLLSPDQHELWMRSLVAGLLLMFSVYFQFITKQRERTAKELEKHRNHLEELVSERTAELKRANEQLGQEIIERQRAKETLRKKANEKRAILNSMSELLTYQDAEHKVIWANRVAGESIGLTPEDLVGRYCYEIWQGHSKPCEDCPVSRVLETGQVQEGEKTTPDGRIWFLRSFPVRDENDNIMGMVQTRLDITERKRTAEELRTSEERYRILAENVAEGVGIIQDGKLTFANTALAYILGYDMELLAGMEFIGFIRDDYKHRFKEMLKGIDNNIDPNYFEAPCIRVDSREIWIEAGHSLISWEGRTAILVTVRDITKAKHREMAIQDEAEHLRMENVRLKSSMKERYRFGNIIGKSAVMQEVYDLILKASATDASVIIYGESGTGKEIVARTIHEMSDRQHEAFVPVNCGAIPETLFESEFFGHRKGAFTGAHIDKHGFFDLASGGTLFLDEVGELSPSMQVKLLRVIEGGGYTPVGDIRTRKADVRIVAATNRNLTDMLRNGLVREDFLYRIHVIPVSVPPLRNRKEDIALLVDHFLKLHGNGKKRPTMSGKILNALYNHDWPGNIRELENVLKRYLTTESLEFIRTATDDPDSMGPVSVAALHQEEGLGLRKALETYEKEYISKLLVQNQWHRTKTAAVLGIPERTLYRKLKQFRLTTS